MSTAKIMAAYQNTWEPSSHSIIAVFIIALGFGAEFTTRLYFPLDVPRIIFFIEGKAELSVWGGHGFSLRLGTLIQDGRGPFFWSSMASRTLAASSGPSIRGPSRARPSS